MTDTAIRVAGLRKTYRGRAAVDDQVTRGLVVRDGERLVLTPTGRLLADGVVRDLLT